MLHIMRFIAWSCLIGMLPELAYAAGTYYTGNYRSPQQNYSTMSYANRIQNASYSRDSSYTRTRTSMIPNANVYVGPQYQGYDRNVIGQSMAGTQQAQQQAVKKSNKGLSLAAAFSHEFAMWNFDMNSAGSKLHYDNIRWNTLGLSAIYRFDSESTPMQIDAGFKYGMQYGDSTMVDDDVTNGGYLVTEWWSDNDADGDADELIGSQVGHSFSVGNSSTGNLLEFYAGIGLTDWFKLGSGARITPSIGYRYLKYKLETDQDYGLTVDTGYCTTITGTNEVQCDPIVILEYGNEAQVLWNPTVDENGFWEIGTGANGISTGGTYAFYLPSVSHSYETEWMGPYLALDLDYDINAYNSVNARVEFGLPTYRAVGDQPYRTDWQHPTSVEDKGDFGDAWHIGFAANYMTALSAAVSLSIGITFDYYNLSGGSATTYLNSAYYMDIYNSILNEYIAAGLNEQYMLNGYISDGVEYPGDATALLINEYRQAGWKMSVDNEIESIYRSMGLRVGFVAKF